MDNNLKSRIKTAIDREWNDDHLDELEKKVLCDMIRAGDNIDPEVPDEMIYDDYVINA